MEGSNGSTGFDYSNLTFSDSNDYTSEFSFVTPAPIDSIRKRMLEKEANEWDYQLNERRELFEDGILSDFEQSDDDEGISLSGAVAQIVLQKQIDANQTKPDEYRKVCGDETKEKVFDVNKLAEMTYKSFNLNEDLLNNNNIEEDLDENFGVLDDDDKDL